MQIPESLVLNPPTTFDPVHPTWYAAVLDGNTGGAVAQLEADAVGVGALYRPPVRAPGASSIFIMVVGIQAHAFGNRGREITERSKPDICKYPLPLEIQAKKCNVLQAFSARDDKAVARTADIEVTP